jgi:hypothetical protein
MDYTKQHARPPVVLVGREKLGDIGDLGRGCLQEEVVVDALDGVFVHLGWDSVIKDKNNGKEKELINRRVGALKELTPCIEKRKDAYLPVHGLRATLHRR